MTRVLLVTNDFPPRQGGIQSFVYELVRRLPAETTMVYASDYRDSAAFDAEQAFNVVRHPTGLLIPTPAASSRIRSVAREFGATAVWFGAAAPLGLLAPALRDVGVERVVASTHGHEIGWAALPGTRQLLQRIADGCDVLTYLGGYTHTRLARAVGSRTDLVQLAPGVDFERFHPGEELQLRERYGMQSKVIISCVSRLVPRKGQDVLIQALPAIRQNIPDAVLLLVGSGPYEGQLRKLAAQHHVTEHVVFTGSVSPADLPRYYRLGDLFAMPCRTRRKGLDVEGLGIVYLEASASGLPVIAGDSGGAPDAVQDGVTGRVVDGRDSEAVAEAIVAILRDPVMAEEMAKAGRAWIEQAWGWDAAAERLRLLLGA